MTPFLSNPVILALTALAVLATCSARFIHNRNISCILQISGFLLVIANITYALLLGAELSDVLIYILVFALIGSVAFLPKDAQKADVYDASETKNGAQDKLNETPDVENTETEEQK